MGKRGGKGGETSRQTSNSKKKRNKMENIVTGRMEVEWKGGTVESNKGFWY
jgi:hypothetical protein